MNKNSLNCKNAVLYCRYKTILTKSVIKMASAGKDQQRHLLEHYLLVENCLIAELHRLRSIAPLEFFINENNKEKFGRLIVDFTYFENPRLVDELIEKDEVCE